MRIVFTGGGTGGHFYPMLAVALAVRQRAADMRLVELDMFYFGSDPYRPDLVDATGLKFRRVFAGKRRSYISIQNFIDPFKTALGVVTALWYMLSIVPDVVFAKGGFDSFPTLMAARLFRIPVIIHESDAVPGAVNRWAGRWADRIAVGFVEAAQYFPEDRVAHTGIPLRAETLQEDREAARQYFGVLSDRPVLFITGGSQGAKIINDAVVEILDQLLGRFEVIHQVGTANVEEMRYVTAPILREKGEAFYHMAGSLEANQMSGAYALADIVVARAGGTTIAEIAAWGKPAILIPLAIAAQQHQKKNAYIYATAGAGIFIDEENLTPTVLWHELKRFMDEPDRMRAMAEAAKKFARRDAAAVIAEEVLRLGSHEHS
ncbi:UDP-N-acetylglucosamine--N-acetylmuramyl-(pentapeptide) pyrophosphoryl-undecaprenol N-acetylglucosamine transferase [Candidatus Parcubacteria bacterium]|nr:MAG: UDP-N-acetylglucosamine--N-acetylmuramyl-(pentapeptide) pyrophosphoryl-undecaprenol N-acetylglucosamine transferase [Candidatus Parcubacteria bacterium]